MPASTKPRTRCAVSIAAIPIAVIPIILGLLLPFAATADAHGSQTV